MWRYSRTLVEALHAVTAVVATLVAFTAASRAYPPGRQTIWTIGIVTVATIVGMLLPQLLAAWREDRARRHG